MKTLKFTPELCNKIISGEKTSTWRLFDDKDLKEGDALVLLNKETLEAIGTALITNLYTKTLSTLEESDWVGHERFSSEDEMYATYRKYYGDAVDRNTEVKIISFSFQPLATEYEGQVVSFVETMRVKDGVVCDVYKFDNDQTKDLGIVKVSKGFKTPLQAVLNGDKTIERYVSGTGSLTVTKPDGTVTTYEFPSINTDIEVGIGDQMQWEAKEDLVFNEICYPPYQDGRFKNLSDLV